ncbi:tetratricopeptide repeat-containing sensor histidine kinase [Dyadobacter pollutisoli]|uniref:histidine kinase n=1 Tax=Dyadobacter pollutisoli TaxID=2910158 RepID=A0A9E8SN29_9BACT|nr:histidine kinase dimerization/phosphoacceptor domain -containing protein [Dyadobacter pollutisoli]WAC14823.1 tetratricopeptide repeat protein [Dyadobacter pollutisoli]
MLKNLLLLCFLSISLPGTGQDPGPFTAKDTKPLVLALRRSTPDTGKVQLLLKLSDQYYYRLNRQPSDIEKALSYTLEAKKLSISLDYHKGEGISELLLSRILPQKNERENGRKAALKAIAILTKYNEYFQLGEAYYTMSGYYSTNAEEIGQRIALVEKSSEAFGKAGNKEKQGHIYMQLGDLYVTQGSTAKALSALRQSLAFFKAAGYKNLMGVYDLLGRIYLEIGSVDQAIEHGLLAERTAKMLGDTSSMQLCTIYNRLGNAYNALNRFDKQREYQTKALVLALRLKDAESVHIIAVNLAVCMQRLGDFDHALSMLNESVKKYPLKTDNSKVLVYGQYLIIYGKLNLSLGRKYSNIVEEITSKSTLSNINLRYAYNCLILFYFEDKNYKKLEMNLKKSNELARKANFRIYLYQNYLYSARLDSIRGNYSGALENYQKYSLLKDSVFRESKARQMSQLEILYDVEKKNDSIQFLTKQSGLQSGMLRQAGLIQNITYVSIGLLLVIIALLIAGYRLMQKSNRNITVKQDEINRKNISLEHLVNEKEWLIKEIHHRVKNNLHMVAGLLDSQSEYLKTEEAKTAIADSQHRIQSMSMIHQKLYQTENLSSIDISAYIYEMVQYLKDSFDTNQQIHFQLEIERIEMNISHSIPLGLILNEAITNAMKYAFKGDREGTIFIAFKPIGTDYFQLIIADNGIGLRPDFDIKRAGSFGMTLIQGLCDDIGGTLSVKNQDGVTITIEFLYQNEEKDTHR